MWPHGEYPLIPVGQMVLNRNPKNYFSEIEQIAFAPANMVPGIEASPDKMLQVLGWWCSSARLYLCYSANRQYFLALCSSLRKGRPVAWLICHMSSTNSSYYSWACSSAVFRWKQGIWVIILKRKCLCIKYSNFLGYFVVLLTHFTDCEVLHNLWMLQPK